MAEDLIRVLDDAFDPVAVAGLYRAMKGRGRMPASLLYMPKADFDELARGDATRIAALERYAPPELVRFLPGLVARIQELAPAVAEPLCGYEIFMSQHASETPAGHAGLHVDANEPDWDTARVAWGSVFHVGPEAVIEGGGTAFYPRLPVPTHVHERCFAPNTFDSLDALTGEWVVVDRKVNRLVAFDGRLPHYAARCRARPDAPRIALIVTGWITVPRFAPADPHAYSRLEPDEYLALTELTESALAAVRDYERAASEVGHARLTAAARAMAKVAAI